MKPAIIGIIIGVGIFIVSCVVVIIIVASTFKNPDVKYHETRYKNAQTTGNPPNQLELTADIHLNITNENIVGITIDKLVFDIYRHDNTTKVNTKFAFVAKDEKTSINAQARNQDLLVPYTQIFSPTTTPGVFSEMIQDYTRGTIFLFMKGNATYAGIPLPLEFIAEIKTS